jgi:hypothetical protein
LSLDETTDGLVVGNGLLDWLVAEFSLLSHTPIVSSILESFIALVAIMFEHETQEEYGEEESETYE